MAGKSRTSSKSDDSLTEQVASIAAQSGVLAFRNHGALVSLGLIRVDEPEKRLFYMVRWAQGTGDVHVFRWGTYDRNHIFVNFYRARDGELKGVIGPSHEFDPEIDPAADRIDHVAWLKELALHRADYESFFARECEFLKDKGDGDYIAAVDDIRRQPE
jgi:hypothetical protein